MYEAKVLADSIGPFATRLTTVQLTFPRFILAEVNTHRVFSRNSASSRAIPPEKLIAKVREDPFVPETFNKRVKGMGVGESVDEEALKWARAHWNTASKMAIKAAEGLLSLDVDKSRINRLLEPFMWHTAIISATEWDNYFALRCPSGDEPTIEFPAQLEFQKITIMQRAAMRASKPQRFQWDGSWHLPLVLDDEIGKSDGRPRNFWPMVSAGRCARVSFDTHENYEEPEKSYERAERLIGSGHLSPFEHVAKPGGGREFVGNFRGWVQYRKLIPNESNFGRIEGREPWDRVPEPISS